VESMGDHSTPDSASSIACQQLASFIRACIPPHVLIPANRNSDRLAPRRGHLDELLR
jgi:hypothetical protein